MVRKKKTKPVDVKKAREEENEIYRLAYQHYLGNNVCIPKGALPYKETKFLSKTIDDKNTPVKKPSEELDINKVSMSADKLHDNTPKRWPGKDMGL